MRAIEGAEYLQLLIPQSNMTSFSINKDGIQTESMATDDTKIYELLLRVQHIREL